MPDMPDMIESWCVNMDGGLTIIDVDEDSPCCVPSPPMSPLAP